MSGTTSQTTVSSAARWALPVSIGLLALAVTATGTAVAATGQLVNIVDGTTATNVAKVDGTGALRTLTTGTVGARPVVPTSVFRDSSRLTNFYSTGQRQVVLGPTTATLAVSQATYTLTSTVGATVRAWDGAVFQVSGATVSECQANTALARRAVVRVPLTNSVTVGYGDAPLVLKPLPGKASWCLVASFGPDSQTAGEPGTFWTDFTGYVVAGTFSSPDGAAADSASGSGGRTSATGEPLDR